MTKIKFCGLSRACDMKAANELMPDYIGFVFVPKSKRYVSPAAAAELKGLLVPGIKAVGVFINETPEQIADLLNKGIIDMAQLHGDENENFIRRLQELTDKPVIKAFRIVTANDIKIANQSAADYILLDSGAGTGTVFDWDLVKNIDRPYFLAGGLSPANVPRAVSRLRPYAVDVSSGIEMDGFKSKTKMAAFAAAIRKEDSL
ncbi:phosphoribosylanthranilate isomerase [uncultured Dubosiella sp.]|jgi:phosphoribosylanthranilate isomerase|uniref:phosphoribosylanthranilate isomerase n=1 Tax=uncultured Dubosiella sp. TaxID=1937011 RepID=UPI0026009D7A|nr:phosphoribosylanthranilate isomerase [uncultured Dubosiella sp.]